MSNKLIPVDPETPTSTRRESTTALNRKNGGNQGKTKFMVFDGDNVKQEERDEVYMFNDNDNTDVLENNPNPSRFIDKFLSAQVPLSDLYSIVGSCFYNQAGQYCPVLLKQKLESEDCPRDTDAFIIQVWDIHGKCLYEHKHALPCNWGIFGNKFVYQIEKKIYLVQLFFHKQAIVQCYELDDSTADELKVKAVNPVNLKMGKNNDSPQLHQFESQNIAFFKNHIFLMHDHMVYYFKIDTVHCPCIKGDGICAPSHPVAPTTEVEYLEPDEMYRFKVSKDNVNKTNLLGFVNVGTQEVAIVYDEIVEENGKEHGLLKFRKLVDVNTDGSDEVLGELKVKGSKIKRNYSLLFTRLGQGMDDDNFGGMANINDNNTYQTTHGEAEEHHRFSLFKRGSGSHPYHSDVLKMMTLHLSQKQRGGDVRDVMVSIVLRKTHKVELYYDYHQIPITLNGEELDKISNVQEVWADFNKLYIQMKDKTWFKINLNWGNRINFDMKQDHRTDKDKIQLHNRLRNHFNLYTEMESYSTYMFVCHRNFISIYDFETQRFTHKMFDEWVRTINCIRFSPDDSQKVDPKDCEGQCRDQYMKKLRPMHLVAVVGNTIKMHQIPILTNEGDDQLEQFDFAREFSLGEGEEIVKWSPDDLNFNLAMITRVSSDPNYSGMQRRELDDGNKRHSNFNVQTHFNHKDYESNFTYYVKVLENNTIHNLVSAHKDEVKASIDSFQTIQSSDEQIFTCEYLDYTTQLRIYTGAGFRKYMADEETQNDNTKDVDVTPFIKLLLINKKQTKCRIYCYQLNEPELVDGKMTDLKLMPDPRESSKITLEGRKDRREPAQINGFITLESKDFYGRRRFTDVLILQDRILCFEPRQKQIIVSLEGLRFKQTQFIDGKYLYGMMDACHQPVNIVMEVFETGELIEKTVEMKEPGGLYCLNIPRLINSGSLELVKVSNAIIGHHSKLDYSDKTQQLIFMRNFHMVRIIPLVHRNNLIFHGMKKRKDYLITLQHDGLFSALDKNGMLITWKVENGQILQTRQLESDEANAYDGFEVYQANETDASQFLGYYSIGDSALSLICRKKSDIDLETNITTESMFENDNDYVNDDMEPIKQQTSTATDRYEFKVLLMQAVNHETNAGLAKTVRKSASNLEDEWLGVATTELFSFEMDLREEDGTKDYIFMEQDFDVENRTLKIMRVHKMTTAKIYEVSRGNLHPIAQKEIKQYPSILQGNCSLPFLFTSDFNYYIDMNLTRNQLEIKETKPIGKKKKVENVWRIPPDIIDLVADQIDLDKNACRVVSRMHFIGDNLLRLVTENGLDCLYAFDRSKTDKDCLKLLSSTKIDNFSHQNMDLDPNFFYEKIYTPNTDVTKRLKNTSEGNKTWLDQYNFLSIPDNVRSHLKRPKNQKDHSRYRCDNIFRVNYDIDEGRSVGETYYNQRSSFTCFSWLTLYQVVKYKKWSFEQIDPEEVLRIGFGIYPSLRTALHFIAFGMDEGSSVATNDLFNVVDRGQIAGTDGCKPEMPVIEDCFGNTAMDIALGIQEEMVEDGIGHKIKSGASDAIDLVVNAVKRMFCLDHVRRFSMRQQRSGGCCKGSTGRGEKDESSYEKALGDHLNLQLAQTLFHNLHDYGYMHAGSSLVSAIVRGVEINLPGMGEYINNRMKNVDSKYLSTQNSPLLHKSTIEGKTFGTVESEPIIDSKDVMWQMYQDNGAYERVNYMSLDVPLISSWGNQGRSLVNALSGGVHAAGLEVFESEALKMLIDYYFRTSSSVIYLGYMLPQWLQLALFTYWVGFLLPSLGRDKTEFYLNSPNMQDYFERDTMRWLENSQETALKICENGLFFIGVYRLVINFLNFTQKLKSDDVMIEFISNSLTSVLTLYLVFVVEKQEYEAIMNGSGYNVLINLSSNVYLLSAVTTLCLWLQFIMTLQLFKSSSYMIFLLKRSIIALMPFTMLTLITIFAFAEVMYQLQLQTGETDSEKQFASSTVDALQKMLFTTFGNWGDETANFSPFAWILFIFVLIMNNVILFNFVVAQASDEYTTYVVKKEQSFFYLKSNVIEDCYFLLLLRSKIRRCLGSDEANNTKMLLIANVLDADQAIKGSTKAMDIEAKENMKTQNQLLNQILVSVRNMEDREHLKNKKSGGSSSKYEFLPNSITTTTDGPQDTANMVGSLNGGINHMNKTFEKLIDMHTSFNHNQKALATALQQ